LRGTVYYPAMGKLRFILGRAGTGKTRYCLNQAVRRLRESALDGPAVVLLVPEQATFQMSRTLARWKGLRGFVRAKVVSFRSLARQAIIAGGEVKKPLLNFSRKVVMQRILAAMQGELKFWNNVRPERISGAILQLLDELSQAELGPEKLEEICRGMAVSGELGDKLSDLILVGRAYLKMDFAGLEDPLGYLDRYRQMIDKLEWLKGSYLFVDEFSGFTGQEYAALGATMQAAKETCITLSLDPDRLGKEPLAEELRNFWPCEETYFRLMDLAKGAGVAVGGPIVLRSGGRRFRNSSLLCQLERTLAGGEEKIKYPISNTQHPMSNGGEERGDILLVSAQEPAHEVELAAGKILQLVREKGYRFRDLSVILRSLDSYEHSIRYSFERYHIPYFLDVRRPIAHHPLTRMIQAAIGAVGSGFETRWMLRYLKSGMTTIPEYAVGRIENYVLAHGIEGKNWLAEWRYRTDSASSGDEWNFAAINDYRRELVRPLKNLEGVIGVRDGISQGFSVEGIIDGLVGFLVEMDVSKKLEELQNANCQYQNSKFKKDQNSQIHQQIWEVLVELLGQLKVTLAGKDLGLVEFLEVLTDSFSESTVGVIPSSADQVLVGTIERSRHPAVRGSFVLGFNEGVWPLPPVDDVVLTDSERARFSWKDLPVKGSAAGYYLKEQYLTYIALTRASEFLWVSFSRWNGAGSGMLPSRYLGGIARAGGKEIIALREEVPSVRAVGGDLVLPLTGTKLVGDVIMKIRGGEGDFWVELGERLNTHPKTREVFRDFVKGFSGQNLAEISAQVAGELYSRQVSFSQIESFYRCPFQYFCKYGLGLRIPPRYKLEPVDLGQFRHDVMAQVWKEIVRLGERWKGVTGEQVREIVGGVAAALGKDDKYRVLLSNARNRFILDRTRYELTLAVVEQLRMVKPSRYRPVEFETKFTYPITVDGTSYELVGRIDRIDTNHEWVLIIDYKSGATSFKLRDWFAGAQLQLPGYLFVSTQDGRRAAGAIFLPLVPQRAKGNGSFFPASGFINVEALTGLVDLETEEYPYGIKIKKDGQPAENGPVVSEEVMAGILRRTRKMVEDGLRAMGKGEIGITPYFDGKVSVCPLCEMHGVCRFDHYVNRYRGIGKISKETLLEEITK